MNDPWKFVAFVLASISGYLSSSIVASIATQNYGLPELPGNLLVVAAIGLFTGFLVDELIPAYVKSIRGSSGGGGDFDAGGGGDDFDFDD
jgi:hypothetical protein